MEDKSLMNIGLTALDVQDRCDTRGGALIDYLPVLKKLTPAAFAIWTIENWEEVKKGFSDGWNVK